MIGGVFMITEQAPPIMKRILDYAIQCLNDEIPSCKAHKGACRRLIRDYKRSIDDDTYPYYWDEEEPRRIINWFSLLRHSQGELAGQPIILTDWQCFHICQLYGWKKKSNGRRRFRKMFIEVARKNAKSQELAGICLYEASAGSVRDGELHQVFTAGVKRQQSKVVICECAAMLNGSPARKKFRVTKNNGIYYEPTNSYILPLSKDDKNGRGDGSNPSLLCIDEYHAHDDNSFVSLSIGSNTKQPILAIITTAGTNLSSPCKSEYDFCKRVLDDNFDDEDDEYLIDICEMDPEDYTDIKTMSDERLWLKANPIRASYPEGVNHLRSAYKTIIDNPSKAVDNLTKAFNIWCEAKDGSYMDMKKWRACEVEKPPIDLNGRECTIGLDLSSKIDLTSAAFTIKYETGKLDPDGLPEEKIFVMNHSFIPNREKLLERELVDKVPYSAWERMGFLTVLDSQVINQKDVMIWCEDFCREKGMKIKEWALDPSNGTMLETTLIERGYNVCEIYQSYAGLNEATNMLREDVYSGHLLHLKDPLLDFAMGNAIVRHSDGKIKIDKDMRRHRIDPVDALICAYKYEKLLDKGERSKKEAIQKMHDDLRKFLIS